MADFFEAGKTYIRNERQLAFLQLVFRCEHVTVHPRTGEQRAFGFHATVDPGDNWNSNIRTPKDWANGWVECEISPTDAPENAQTAVRAQVRTDQVWADASSGNAGCTVRVIDPDPDSALVEVVTMADQPRDDQHPLRAVGRRFRVFYNDRGLRGYMLRADVESGGSELTTKALAIGEKQTPKENR